MRMKSMAARKRRTARTMIAICGESRPGLSGWALEWSPGPRGQGQYLQGRHVIWQPDRDGRLHV
jgi:hypothetical protein